jgi:5-methylcytosine-specific restriction endonuclease McrA
MSSTNINKYKKHTRLTGNAGVAQRLRIRLRDNYCCRKCSRVTNNGEVDHIIALDDNGTNDDTNLQYLCTTCHKEKTATDRQYTIKTGSTVDGLPTNPNHHWN